MTQQRIVMNISSSVAWRKPPAGIVRVERELAKQLSRLAPDPLVAVCLDSSSQSWKQLSPQQFQQITTDAWLLGADSDHALHDIDTTSLRNFKPSAADRFVSVGSDWSFKVPDLVTKLYGTERVLIPACYDLIPLFLPEYAPGPEFFQQFRHHYVAVAEHAKSVFAISEKTKCDLLAFWDGAGLGASVPPVEVIPLVGMDGRISLPTLSADDQVQLENIQQHGPYVIFVSTLEPRKNHRLLLEIWRRLFDKRGRNCPQLLIIGSRGWGSEDLIEQMSRMDVTQAGKLIWLEGTSDQLLSHLYANSLFSVCPSIYEGWGLGATESLSFGKVCVVSNNSSLLEATYGLTPSFHPLDYISWLNEITRLIDDPLYRKGLEEMIRQHAPQRTWDHFGKEFYERLVF